MNPKLPPGVHEPRLENREYLQPGEQGRYCIACNNQLVDFTGIKDKKLVAFFKAPSPVAVSGRFVSDQPGRSIRQSQRINWLRYFFQFTLPAFLAPAKVQAQGSVKIKRNKTLTCEFATYAERIAKDDMAVLHDAKKLQGRIIDEEGNGLMNVSVTMNTNKRRTASGKDGHFSIRYSDAEKLLLTLSMTGYKTKEIEVDRTWTKPILVMLNRDEQLIHDDVIIIAGKVTAGPAKKVKPAPLIERIMDTAFNYLKVSPNPANAGSGINLEWNKLEEGYYFFQLLNSAGEMVYYREIWIDKQARVMNMELPAVPAGAYYVRLRNKESGKSFSEKLIIQ